MLKPVDSVKQSTPPPMEEDGLSLSLSILVCRVLIPIVDHMDSGDHVNCCRQCQASFLIELLATGFPNLVKYQNALERNLTVQTPGQSSSS